MRKRTSKRRWLARFKIGRVIPWIVIVEWPDLDKRFWPRECEVNRDAFKLSVAR